jgi:hypothetical protein
MCGKSKAIGYPFLFQRTAKNRSNVTGQGPLHHGLLLAITGGYLVMAMHFLAAYIQAIYEDLFGKWARLPENISKYSGSHAETRYRAVGSRLCC